MQELTTFITHHTGLSLATIGVLVVLMLLEFMRAKRNAFNIGPAQVTQLINRHHAVVLDIRSNDAYRKGHIIDAQLIASQEIKQPSKKLEKFKNRPIIIISSANNESQKIAASLLKQGYNAYSLSGGMRAWLEAQMPLVRDEK